MLVTPYSSAKYSSVKYSSNMQNCNTSLEKTLVKNFLTVEDIRARNREYKRKSRAKQSYEEKMLVKIKYKERMNKLREEDKLDTHNSNLPPGLSGMNT